jgi:hypothetical protein
MNASIYILHGHTAVFSLAIAGVPDVPASLAFAIGRVRALRSTAFYSLVFWDAADKILAFEVEK